MSFKKLALASVMSLVLASGAASAKDQGHGVINFSGSIIDAPCSINPDDDNQDVDLGQISNVALESDSNAGTSTPREFKIRLEKCSLGTIKTVTTTFTGSAGVVPDSLGIAGTAKGASIILTDGGNAQIKLGQPTAPHVLQDGNNTLLFTAYLQGDGAAATIVPGDFTSIADFTLAYQ
ncbi:fimbrial protein [Atlantibacter sp.]|uniref:fimbrial protein n=1 Tax=Atlantibacter sp. TaxID=1903473 RepID=UPI0028AE805F|nr:fimbrial protein [Atlantibacter sp.]